MGAFVASLASLVRSYGVAFNALILNCPIFQHSYLYFLWNIGQFFSGDKVMWCLLGRNSRWDMVLYRSTRYAHSALDGVAKD